MVSLVDPQMFSELKPVSLFELQFPGGPTTGVFRFPFPFSRSPQVALILWFEFVTWLLQ